MSEQDQNLQEEIEIPIEWHVSDAIETKYATNMVVQHGDHEFIISFFETKPPLIVGPPSKEVLANLKTIRAECIAQIVVASPRMPKFLQALQTNFEKWQSKQSSQSQAIIKE
jgi:hypothetical protein